MLRIVQNSSSFGASRYFSTADYYSEGQELVGLWRGEAAKRLGLAGTIKKADWDALCYNRHPENGGTLTARQKSNRRVGYDFNFHVPKSVSVLFADTQDPRLLDAFRQSVNETMTDIERDMQTRLRTRGQDQDRVTGNMIWGEYTHLTARPIGGVPDPHLHAHCFAFNATWDPTESRWKAGQFCGIKRDGPFYEAVFHARLARRLEELGLPIVRGKRGWEVEGIPSTVIQTFSRRTEQVERLARDNNITDAKEKSNIGAKSRERKAKNLAMPELQRLWRERMTPDELAAVQSTSQRIGSVSLPANDRIAEEAIQYAIGHCFERNSVVPERRFLAEAIKRGIGATNPETVIAAAQRAGLISAEYEGRRYVTIREVIHDERRMIAYAREGRGTCRRLGKGEHVFKREKLNTDQRHAVEHVLKSPDRVIIVRGAAGVGKTSMMQEAVEAIEANGKKVFTFAPTAVASRGVLRDEGFADSDTVARLVRDEKQQAALLHQVMWIDEAGLLGTPTLVKLFDIAKKQDARVILSGDTRQLGSVERGAALKLLETQAGILPAEILEIKRQQGRYMEAVKLLSAGDLERGLEQLDKLGWVRALEDCERYTELADDYIRALNAKKSVLVVSPTYAEGNRISAEIRARLKDNGYLGTDEKTFSVLTNSQLTEAERTDPANFEPRDVLVFHQNAKGIIRGARISIGDGPLPLDQAARFQVYREGELRLAPGDMIRITKNGFTPDRKHALHNGARYAIKGFSRSGDIVLTNGWTIDKDFGFLTHGYISTSQAAQGTTVDRVLVSISAESIPAASQNGFYVAASRGRHRATIYTDDKSALLEAVRRPEEKMTATELIARDIRSREVVRHQAHNAVQHSARVSEREELVYE
ncbi:MAG: MobF family relaxase [Phycisphaerales bacterium]